MIYDGEDAGDRLDSRNVDKIRREDTTVLFWNLTGLRSSTQDLQKLNKKHKVNNRINPACRVDEFHNIYG